MLSAAVALGDRARVQHVVQRARVQQLPLTWMALLRLAEFDVKVHSCVLMPII